MEEEIMVDMVEFVLLGLAVRVGLAAAEVVVWASLGQQAEWVGMAEEEVEEVETLYALREDREEVADSAAVREDRAVITILILSAAVVVEGLVWGAAYSQTAAQWNL
jgi:hypothetical protein